MLSVPTRALGIGGLPGRGLAPLHSVGRAASDACGRSRSLAKPRQASPGLAEPRRAPQGSAGLMASQGLAELRAASQGLAQLGGASCSLVQPRAASRSSLRSLSRSLAGLLAKPRGAPRSLGDASRPRPRRAQHSSSTVAVQQHTCSTPAAQLQHSSSTVQQGPTHSVGRRCPCGLALLLCANYLGCARATARGGGRWQVVLGNLPGRPAHRLCRAGSRTFQTTSVVAWRTDRCWLSAYGNVFVGDLTGGQLLPSGSTVGFLSSWSGVPFSEPSNTAVLGYAPPPTTTKHISGAQHSSYIVLVGPIRRRHGQV